MATLRVTYRVSSIGHNRRQKETVRSLGLRRLNQTVELPDREEVRGMVNFVRHLVTVEAVPDPAEETPAPPKARTRRKKEEQ